MSEYWVSRKKYFCKYCDIYIADDAPSRQQHENGMRHKGNKDRFIRGLYKAGEKRVKDLADEKREMARVDQAAHAAFAQDVGAGLARPSALVASTSAAAAPKKLPVKPSNPYANYSTAASLGYTDPDAERLAAEAERKRAMGVAGEWEYVATPAAPAPAVDETDTVAEGSGLKREADAPADDEDSRRFKLRKKTMAVGLGEIYDPGLIPIKLKKKEEASELTLTPSTPATSASVASTSTATNGLPPATDAPKWTTLHWKKPGETTSEGEVQSFSCTGPSVQNKADVPNIKAEDDTTALASSVVPEGAAGGPQLKEEISDLPLKLETLQPPAAPEGASSSSMFRKRKAPAGVGRR